MPFAPRVYVVVRFDGWGDPPLRPDQAGSRFTVIEVLPDEESAEREMDRLNALNGDKGCRYSFQSARWYPLGREVKPQGPIQS